MALWYGAADCSAGRRGVSEEEACDGDAFGAAPRGVGVVLASRARRPGPAARRVGAPIPAEDNVKVTSFDGTQLNVDFFPAAGLATDLTAPTVLEPSGWGLPAYPSWVPTINSISLGSVQLRRRSARTGGADRAGVQRRHLGQPRLVRIGRAGNLDNPAVEGRDVSAIIDWLAAQPGVTLKGPNDPVVGMIGASYGGGLQLSAAAIDHRIDAIVPDMSWYSLIDSLYPNQVVKAGWGSILCLSGNLEGARYAPEVTNLCTGALKSGIVTPDEVAYGDAASPGPLVGQITTPTLLLAGTVDTLFPINGDIATYDALRAAGTPVKMMWFCGGHGLCNQSAGPANHVPDVELAFLGKYLMHRDVSIGPGFEYLDQTGTWRSAPSYPVAPTGRLTASGSGTLFISPWSSSGLLGIEATKASNAVNIPVGAPSSSVDTVTDPELSLTYKGYASKASTPIFAQLLDSATGKVLDNQATAVPPLTLDGASHTVTLPLNMVTWNLTPASTIVLQLTDSSDLFFAQKALGIVHLQAKLTLATSPG